MTVTRKSGRQAKTYRNIASWASPSWSEMKIVKDVLRDSKWGDDDASTRESVFELSILTLLSSPINLQVAHVPANAHYIALREAFENGTTVEMLVLDGDVTTAGSRGIRADWHVVEFPEAQPLKGEMMHEVVLKMAQTGNAPTWYAVTT